MLMVVRSRLTFANAVKARQLKDGGTITVWSTWIVTANASPRAVRARCHLKDITPMTTLKEAIVFTITYLLVAITSIQNGVSADNHAYMLLATAGMYFMVGTGRVVGAGAVALLRRYLKARRDNRYSIEGVSQKGHSRSIGVGMLVLTLACCVGAQAADSAKSPADMAGEHAAKAIQAGDLEAAKAWSLIQLQQTAAAYAAPLAKLTQAFEPVIEKTPQLIAAAVEANKVSEPVVIANAYSSPFNDRSATAILTGDVTGFKLACLQQKAWHMVTNDAYKVEEKLPLKDPVQLTELCHWIEAGMNPASFPKAWARPTLDTAALSRIGDEVSRLLVARTAKR